MGNKLGMLENKDKDVLFLDPKFIIDIVSSIQTSELARPTPYNMSA
jgi:hypothetical protein